MHNKNIKHTFLRFKTNNSVFWRQWYTFIFTLWEGSWKWNILAFLNIYKRVMHNIWNSTNIRGFFFGTEHFGHIFTPNLWTTVKHRFWTSKISTKYTKVLHFNIFWQNASKNTKMTLKREIIALYSFKRCFLKPPVFNKMDKKKV